MRLRNLAALAALHMALAACAETPRTVGHVEAAAQGPTLPPIGELCLEDEGDTCLEYYHLFSSEAFGTGGLTEHLLELKRWEEKYETQERLYRQGDTILQVIYSMVPHGGTPKDAAEWTRHERETIQEFVAQWLVAYPSDREAYLAMAAAALEHALNEYCSELPQRAIRQREIEREIALGLRTSSGGSILAKTLEGGGPGSYVDVGLGLVAPGYENASESLLQYAPCDPYGGQ